MTRMQYLVMASVLTMACGAVIPPLPSHGGPAWFELKTEHFTLWTDGTPAQGRALMRELEHRRQIIMRAMNHAPHKAQVLVIAFRNQSEADAYAPRAFAWDARRAPRQPGLVFAIDRPPSDHVVGHELAHVISDSIVRTRPAWLSEGIACYFQTADLDPARPWVQIGIPQADLLSQDRPLAVAKLLACDRIECKDHEFYRASWALFSFLINEHFDAFNRYLQRLDELPWEQRGQAWQEAFSDLPLDELDRRLADRVARGAFVVPRIRVTVRDYPVTERRLGDGDVLAARSLLNAFAQRDDAARADAAAAIAADRTNVLGHLMGFALTHTVAADDARATAAAHPDDWRAWFLIDKAVPGTPEAARAIDRICALAPEELPACADREASAGAAPTN